MQIEKKWMIFFYESMKQARSLLLIVYKQATVREGCVSWGHFCCVLFHAKTGHWLNKGGSSRVCVVLSAPCVSPARSGLGDVA